MKITNLIILTLLFIYLCPCVSAQDYNCGTDVTISDTGGAEITLHNNEKAKCVSYKTVMKFLEKDKTDENDYSESYNCVYFTEELHNHAETKKIKCTAVTIFCEDDTAHMLVMFPLKNGDNLYIEPQSDCIANVEIGENYKVYDEDGDCIWKLGEIEEINRFF